MTDYAVNNIDQYGDGYMEPEEEWEREGLLDPAWEKQQKKVYPDFALKRALPTKRPPPLATIGSTFAVSCVQHNEPSGRFCTSANFTGLGPADGNCSVTSETRVKFVFAQSLLIYPRRRRNKYKAFCFKLGLSRLISSWEKQRCRIYVNVIGLWRITEAVLQNICERHWTLADNRSSAAEYMRTSLDSGESKKQHYRIFANVTGL
uniref:Uncharacterized protein n=1 Tax=Timema bartmani TaxID=61472 RepID=A0A7R9HYG5_9NEOP|nr:unnamed protein product [Timema bartmani]